MGSCTSGSLSEYFFVWKVLRDDHLLSRWWSSGPIYSLCRQITAKKEGNVFGTTSGLTGVCRAACELPSTYCAPHCKYDTDNSERKSLHMHCHSGSSLPMIHAGERPEPVLVGTCALLLTDARVQRDLDWTQASGASSLDLGSGPLACLFADGPFNCFAGKVSPQRHRGACGRSLSWLFSGSTSPSVCVCVCVRGGGGGARWEGWRRRRSRKDPENQSSAECAKRYITSRSPAGQRLKRTQLL